VQLFSLCAEDRDNSSLWAELLRRITPKIKHFIRGTLRQSLGPDVVFISAPIVFGGIQESDLFQTTIVRLVENDCAAMKRFGGESDEQLMAYLAVITRSAVRDCLRRMRAKKRPLIRADAADTRQSGGDFDREAAGNKSPEREVLGRELKELSHKLLESGKGRFPGRDKLIFQLYFFNDLSAGQIARCEGINLSKAGVEKVLNRLKDRIRSNARIGASEAAW
jgi:RNA polymerase sigma factor (sigma-70 family)